MPSSTDLDRCVRAHSHLRCRAPVQVGTFTPVGPISARLLGRVAESQRANERRTPLSLKCLPDRLS